MDLNLYLKAPQYHMFCLLSVLGSHPNPLVIHRFLSTFSIYYTVCLLHKAKA